MLTRNTNIEYNNYSQSDDQFGLDQNLCELQQKIQQKKLEIQSLNRQGITDEKIQKLYGDDQIIISKQQKINQQFYQKQTKFQITFSSSYQQPEFNKLKDQLHQTLIQKNRLIEINQNLTQLLEIQKQQKSQALTYYKQSQSNLNKVIQQSDQLREYYQRSKQTSDEEIFELQNKLNQKETQIVQFRYQYQEKIQQLKIKNGEYKNLIEEIQNELQKLREYKNNALFELDKLKQQNQAMLNEKQQNHQVQVFRLKNELRRMFDSQVSVENYKKQVQILQNKIHHILKEKSQQNNELRQQIIKLKQSNQEYKSNILLYIQQLRKHSQECQKLQRQIHSLKTINQSTTQYQNDKNSMKRYNQQLLNQINKLQKQISLNSQKIYDQSKCIEYINNENQNLKAENQQLKSKTTQFTFRQTNNNTNFINNVQKIQSERQTYRENYQSQIRNLQNKYFKLKQIINLSLHQNEILDGDTILYLLNITNSLFQIVKALESKTKNRIEDDRNVSRQNEQKMKNKIALKKIEKLREDEINEYLGDYLNKISDLEQEIEKLKNDNKSLKNRINNMENERLEHFNQKYIKNILDQIQQLKRENVKFQQMLRIKQKQLNYKTNQLETKNDQEKKLKQNLQKKSSEIEKFKLHLKNIQNQLLANPIYKEESNNSNRIPVLLNQIQKEQIKFENTKKINNTLNQYLQKIQNKDQFHSHKQQQSLKCQLNQYKMLYQRTLDQLKVAQQEITILKKINYELKSRSNKIDNSREKYQSPASHQSYGGGLIIKNKQSNINLDKITKRNIYLNTKQNVFTQSEKRIGLKEMKSETLNLNDILKILQYLCERFQRKIKENNFIPISAENIYLIFRANNLMQIEIYQTNKLSDITKYTNPLRKYLSPQYIRQGNLSSLSLSWNLGILMDEFLNDRHYFKSQKQVAEPAKIYIYQNKRFPEMKKLLQSLLQKNMASRMHIPRLKQMINQLLRH